MTLGILGGMGPLAGAVFAERMIRMTDASRDGDHIPFFLSSPAYIPPRSDYLTGKSDVSPLPAIEKEILRLGAAGADYIAVTCNTAHAFLPTLRKISPVPILDMLSETAKTVAAKGVSAVPVFATRGTVLLRLYDRALILYGMAAVYPTEKEQAVIDTAIAAVKAGISLPDRCYTRLLSRYSRRYGTVITGCTELSLLSRPRNADVTDPMDALARAAVLYAGKPLRKAESPIAVPTFRAVDDPIICK